MNSTSAPGHASQGSKGLIEARQVQVRDSLRDTMIEREPLTTAFYDSEAQEEYLDSKLDRQLRHGFIRKVFGIISMQLLMSFAVGAFFTFCIPARNWLVHSGIFLLFVSAIVAAALSIAITCVPTLAETYPRNYILLFLFTAFESIALGGVCAIYSLQPKGQWILLEALICTGVVVVGLTLFAYQTKYDFISWAGVLSIVLMVVFSFGLIRLFFPTSPVVETVYASIVALIFAVYLIIDMQLLFGKKSQRFTEDQYIVAALAIYLDIINLFLQILRILGELNRRD